MLSLNTMGNPLRFESQKSSSAERPPTGKEKTKRSDYNNKYVNTRTRKKNPTTKPTSLQKYVQSDSIQKSRKADNELNTPHNNNKNIIMTSSINQQQNVEKENVYKESHNNKNNHENDFNTNEKRTKKKRSRSLTKTTMAILSSTKNRTFDNMSPRSGKQRKRGSFKRKEVSSNKKMEEEYQSVSSPSLSYYHQEESRPKSTESQLEDPPKRTPPYPILHYEPDYDTSGLLTELTGFDELNHDIYESNHNMAILHNSRSEMDISEDAKKTNHGPKIDSKNHSTVTSIIGSLFIQNQSPIPSVNFVWADITVLATVFISVMAIRLVAREGQGMGLLCQWFCSICSVIFALYLRIQKHTMYYLINGKNILFPDIDYI